MGYYVYGVGSITIDHDKVDDAYKALCKLNERDDLKRGGSWGGSGSTADHSRPEGLSYHPARWFSWMDADYPSKCKDLIQILEMLGFEVEVDITTNSCTRYDLRYNQKMGQEELFLQALAPYLTDGYIEWKGEDDSMWKDVFVGGSMEVKKGYVVYR